MNKPRHAAQLEKRARVWLGMSQSTIPRHLLQVENSSVSIDKAAYKPMVKVEIWLGDGDYRGSI